MIRKLLVEPPMTAEEAVRWTTPEERAEAAAFGSERRRTEFLGWRALVRRELGTDVQIGYDAVGAPVLTGSDCAFRSRIVPAASPSAFPRSAVPWISNRRRAISAGPKAVI